MGAAASHVRRIFRNWNVENRAYRAIERDDRPAPPRYPTDEKRLAQAHHENTTPRSEIPGLEDFKNPELDDRLKNIRIHNRGSALDSGANIERDPRTPTQPLPQDRGPVILDEFGYFKPVRIPPGKISMDLALKFLSAYQQDPEKFNIKDLSREYRLMEEDAAALARYFRVFALFIPQVKERQPEMIDLKKTFFSLPRDLRIPMKGGGEAAAYKEGHMFHEVYVNEVEKRQAEDDKSEAEEKKAKEAGIPLPLKSDLEGVPSDIGAVDPEERLRTIDRRKR